VTTVLVSHRFNERFGDEFAAAALGHGIALELLVLPRDADARIDDAMAARAEIALFSADVYPVFGRQFFSATRAAARLKWLHVFNAGVDHPVYASILERGIRLTTSSGTMAEPIAQTAITGLLMLARRFPRWLAAQRERRWQPLSMAESPRDLRGQVMLIYGLGRIGREVARLARSFALKVIGIRRSGGAADEVDELHTPNALHALLPSCDWLVLACPLNRETRGVIDARAIARLPRGAGIINVARGEVVDEAALIAALESGHVGGAYLDVFVKEPLPAQSPLWAMQNVIVTPHNAGLASGNESRVNALFLDNLVRWTRGEPLLNEVTRL
jgi:D-2-hydroxyacid dehydrogenase (NADP+)